MFISTPAPLAGRDCGCAAGAVRSLKFQPTRPLRGATTGAGRIARQINISTHAPLAGRDVDVMIGFSGHLLISTHAPLAGRDHDACTI